MFTSPFLGRIVSQFHNKDSSPSEHFQLSGIIIIIIMIDFHPRIKNTFIANKYKHGKSTYQIRQV